jgi:hypothetical protein
MINSPKKIFCSTALTLASFINFRKLFGAVACAVKTPVRVLAAETPRGS